MLFNSLSFAVFLPVVFALFWLCPQRLRWVVLLISSYYFYMCWNVKYVVLILLTTAISYVTALLIDRTQKQQLKKLCLAAALVISLGILFLFKYFNFFSSMVASFLRYFSFDSSAVVLDVLLPVGISFYTFQTLSYVVDVYRGRVRPEPNFGKYAAFISFFPQLVAGPIERTENLLPQISREHTLDYDKAAYGLKLMAWGYFKKIVIADNLAIHVDRVFGCVYNYTGFTFVIATLMFGIQIYCDFSGYSDIAIGTAKLFDIDLMQNFKSPYFSASIKEFWSRWHISLSTWFRDYVYIPLGGNRCSRPRHMLNLFITFLASGLWHGAAWNYVIWGALHGLAQVAENLLVKNKRLSLSGDGRCIKTWLGVLLTFVFTMFAWIFFRIPDMDSALFFFSHLFTNIRYPLSYVLNGFKHMNIDAPEFCRLAFMTALLLIFDYCNLKKDVIQAISSKPKVIRWTVYIGFSLMILFLLPEFSGGEFIYFQF